MEKLPKKLWFWLSVMALLSPLGVVLPKLFGAEDAWGEWGTDTLARLLGYVPEGLERTADVWKAPLPDYSTMSHLLGETGSYLASAVIGGSLVTLLAFAIARLCAGRAK
jgi:hypothetical protein